MGRIRIGDDILLGDLLSDEFARSLRVRFELKNKYLKRHRVRRSDPLYKHYGHEFVLGPKDGATPEGVDEALTHRTNVRTIIYDPAAGPTVDLSAWPLRLSVASKVRVTGFGY